MKALVFRNDIPRIVATKLAGYLTPAAFSGRFAPITLTDIGEPHDTDGWVVSDTVVTGICGSDAKQVFLNGARDNPMTSLISFPHVLGHEAVGRRHDSGALAVLDPWLGCAARGIDPPCVACAKGDTTHCRNFVHGRFRPGIHLGNCADRGGTHAERFGAHESQLHDLPAHVSVDAGVLADPVSVSLRQVLRTPPDPDRPVLVYGCGTLGLCAVALLRHMHPALEIWAVGKGDVNAGLATKFGANAVLPAAPDDLVDAVAERSDAEPLTTWARKRWILDGPGVVYDTVGSPETVETSLRLVGSEGALAITGVEAPKRFEWTPLYFKEVTIRGSNAFAAESRAGERKHAFDHYFDLVAEGLDVTLILTHRYALADWGKAYTTLARRPRSGAVKVLLSP